MCSQNFVANILHLEDRLQIANRLSVSLCHRKPKQKRCHCDISSLRGFAERRGLTSLRSSFPLLAAGLLAKALLSKRLVLTSFISHHSAPKINLCVVVLKNKRCRKFRHLLLRFAFAERRGFERRSRHRRGSVVAICGSRLAEEVTPCTKFAILFPVFIDTTIHCVVCI